MAKVIKDEWKSLNLKLWGDLTVLEYSIKSDGWRLTGKIHNFQHQIININDKLDEILIRCDSSLTHLNLRSLFFHGFESPIMIVSKYCYNIQHICTSEFLWLTQMELYTIMQRWANVKGLTISLIEKNNETNLCELLNTTKNLKYFALKNHIYTNDMCGMYLNNLPIDSIEEINLTRCVAIVPQLFNEAVKKFKQLRGLTIKSCNFIDNSIIEVITEKKTLKKLYMNNIPTSCAHVFNRLIINLEYLEELSLPDNCWLKDEFLINISWHCRQIKTLDVSLCIGLTNRGIASVSHLKKLEVLKINWVFRVSDEPLGDFNNLKVLTCFGCHEIRDNGIIRLIKLAPYLTKLNLSQCSITNSTIETAISVTNRRRNNIVLEINIFDTDTNLSKLMLSDKSPLLRIIDTDISDSKTNFWDN